MRACMPGRACSFVWTQGLCVCLSCAPQEDATAERMGEAAREHVADSFSRSAFGAALDGYVRGLAASTRAKGLADARRGGRAVAE
jgi:hypothetical protein